MLKIEKGRRERKENIREVLKIEKIKKGRRERKENIREVLKIEKIKEVKEILYL
jgi:hypothetical protein